MALLTCTAGCYAVTEPTTAQTAPSDAGVVTEDAGRQGSDAAAFDASPPVLPDAAGEDAGLAHPSPDAGRRDAALDAGPCVPPQVERTRGSARADAPERVSGEGEFDTEIVARTLATRISAMRACYERELRRDPSLAGTVELMFEVQARGNVTGAEVRSDTTGDPAVGECVKNSVARFRFNPGPEGGSVGYRLRVHFAPLFECRARPKPNPFSCNVYWPTHWDEVNFAWLRDEDYHYPSLREPPPGSGNERFTLFGDGTFAWTIDGTLNARDARGTWSYTSRAERAGVIVLSDRRALAFHFPADASNLNRTRSFADLDMEWGASRDSNTLPFDALPEVDPPQEFCARLGRWYKRSGPAEAPARMTYNNDGTFQAFGDDGCLYAGTWSIDPRRYESDDDAGTSAVEHELAERHAPGCSADAAYGQDAATARYHSPADGGVLDYRGATYLRLLDLGR